jgi:hypothetical protein
MNFDFFGFNTIHSNLLYFYLESSAVNVKIQAKLIFFYYVSTKTGNFQKIVLLLKLEIYPLNKCCLYLCVGSI